MVREGPTNGESLPWLAAGCALEGRRDVLGIPQIGRAINSINLPDYGHLFILFRSIKSRGSMEQLVLEMLFSPALTFLIIEFEGHFSLFQLTLNIRDFLIILSSSLRAAFGALHDARHGTGHNRADSDDTTNY